MLSNSEQASNIDHFNCAALNSRNEECGKVSGKEEGEKWNSKSWDGTRLKLMTDNLNWIKTKEEGNYKKVDGKRILEKKRRMKCENGSIN